MVAIARNAGRLELLKQKAKYPENMHVEIKDLVENIDQLPQYVALLKEKYTRFQGMAYCAGMGDVRPVKLVDMTAMKALYDINLYAPLFMAKGVGDKKNNVGKGTSMVFISSIAANISDKGMSIYAGSKAALSASVRAIAKELAPYGIRANCVLPSDIKTPMTEKSRGNVSRFDKYPMGIGEVEDVANIMVYLLSNKAKWITAQNYVVDCGSC